MYDSLGYDIVDWVEQHLTVPSGPDIGKPLRLTDEQAHILVAYYEVDERGRRIYRRAAVRRAKGWGKSPLLAAIAVAELCGPVVFDGWDTEGRAVGKPHPSPWVQIAAVSEDQAGNTYSAVYQMLSESDLADDLDVGKLRINIPGKNARLEPVTSSAGSREGQLVSFAVLDETHLWVRSNGGVRLAATIQRNTAKMNGGIFESTNAHIPGEGSVAELTYQSANRRDDILYDALEAPPVSDDDIRDGTAKVREAIKIAYGESSWVPQDRIILEGKDPSVDVADFRRFYLNQPVKGERKAVDPARWARLQRDVPLAEKTRIAVGFDGSKGRDATALVGCTAEGHLFVLGLWENPGDKNWTVPRNEVHEAVAWTFDHYDVGMLFADPPLWYSEIDVWADAYGSERVVQFDTRTKRVTAAIDRFLTAYREGSISHDGDERLTRHVVAADVTPWKSSVKPGEPVTEFTFVKGEDGRKIDAAMAAVLAVAARDAMDAAPAPAPDPFILT